MPRRSRRIGVWGWIRNCSVFIWTMRILITVFRFLKLVSLRSLWITARREEEGHGWRSVGEVVRGAPGLSYPSTWGSPFGSCTWGRCVAQTYWGRSREPLAWTRSFGGTRNSTQRRARDWQVSSSLGSWWDFSFYLDFLNIEFLHSTDHQLFLQILPFILVLFELRQLPWSS